MRTRKLGSTGLEVSEVAFGAWQLGNSSDWAGMDDQTAHRLVGEALDGGITLFDTAPNYAGSRSEILLGQALRGRRDDVVLISKFGKRSDGRRDFSVDGFWESLHNSLRRLGTDHLDALLLHNPDASVYEGADPLWEALESARAQGKIRHYGASLDFAHEIEACLRNTKSEILEIFFNILHQDVRRAFSTVREHDAGTIVKIPLDSGWLTGRYDARTRFEGIRSRWSAEEIALRAELVSRLRWLTADGSDLAQKAIAYVLAYEEVSCVIPGIRTRQQLQSNLEAGEVRVSGAERERLEAFWDQFTERGAHLLPW